MSTVGLHLVLCYWLTRVIDGGVAGVGIATMVTCAMNVTFLCIYSWKFTEAKLAPFPSNIASLLKPEDVRVYLAISGPSIILLCAEWWAYELLTVLATFISVGAVGSMAISYNYQSLIFQFPFGFQIGAVAVIGNVIGEENKVHGQMLCLLTLLYSSTITIFFGILTYFYSHEIASMYTQDMDTLALLSNTL